MPPAAEPPPAPPLCWPSVILGIALALFPNRASLSPALGCENQLGRCGSELLLRRPVADSSGISCSPPAGPAMLLEEPLFCDEVIEVIDCEEGVRRIRTLGLRSESRDRYTGRRGIEFELELLLRAGELGAEEDGGGGGRGGSSSSVRERVRPNIGYRCCASAIQFKMSAPIERAARVV